MPNITLRQLSYLVAVAECGSVTGAAQTLHLSQSAVSTSISDLERMLKVQLFVRHARGLSLTRDGDIVLGKARQLLHDAEGLEADAAGLVGRISGTLHVGCYETLSPLLLPGLAAEFDARHPQVSLVFTEGTQVDLLTLLSRGEVDVAVMYGYRFHTELQSLGYRSIRLAGMPPHVLLHPSHRLAGTDHVDLADLMGDPFILYDRNPGTQYFLSLFDDLSAPPRVRYRTTNAELVRCLVGRGLGYSILNQQPRSTVTYEGLPYLVKDLATEYNSLDVVAVLPGDGNRTARVEELLRTARDVLTR